LQRHEDEATGNRSKGEEIIFYLKSSGGEKIITERKPPLDGVGGSK
jgi:hypothetical protein